MGEQEDKIQKLLNTYTKKKNWNVKGWVKIVKDNVSKEEFHNLIFNVNPPKHFHKTWTKKGIIDIWKGDTWESVIDFCNFFSIKPKEVMGYAVNRRINKTDLKTIEIARLVNSSKSKLKPRAKAISLSKKLNEIDSSLEKRGDSESNRQHQERIYQRALKALKRFNL